jgi:hypothetical protein
MSGDSPACKGSCRAEQAQGIWLPGIQSPPPAPARPMQDQDQVLRLSSASGRYAHACLRNKNAKPPPDSRAERCTRRPCPHPCNAKPDPTSAATESAPIQQRCRCYVELTSFPSPSISSQSSGSAHMAHDATTRPREAGREASNQASKKTSNAALYFHAQLTIGCRTPAGARTATPRQPSPHPS